MKLTTAHGLLFVCKILVGASILGFANFLEDSFMKSYMNWYYMAGVISLLIWNQMQVEPVDTNN